MTPVKFPQSNCTFGAPPDLDGSQCLAVQAYQGIISGGSLDGSPLVVVAWKPTDEEKAAIVAGRPIFLACIGGLPPHYLTTDFQTALRPQ
jgi:hypothetical protein